jgi:hypothetical protein
MSGKGYNVCNKMKQWEKNGDVSRIIPHYSKMGEWFVFITFPAIRRILSIQLFLVNLSFAGI